jgi:hypothetical protein
MAKGDKYTVGVQGHNAPVIVAVEVNGRTLKGTFEKESGNPFFIIREQIGKNGRVTKVSYFAMSDLTYILANFETE